jgi:hypothetical protein
MDALDTIRAFNRATLARVGQIETAYGDAGVSLPEARVLVEIAHLGPVQGRLLSDALGLNEGYLSRLLSGLVPTRAMRVSTRRSSRWSRASSRISCEGHDPTCERGWIARAGDARLGSIFCVKGAGAGVGQAAAVSAGARGAGAGAGRRTSGGVPGFRATVGIPAHDALDP